MIHAKFQDHRTTVSGEDFFKVFTIYGPGGHLGHATLTIYINFCSPFQRRLHIKFGFDLVSEEETFEIENGQTTTTETDDDGRQTMGISYKLTYEPLAQVNLKPFKIFFTVTGWPIPTKLGM